jgi:aspartyl-tRNA(Asn)/glutamyl-tRNA(Gln) amidotransferase subunit A
VVLEPNLVEAPEFSLLLDGQRFAGAGALRLGARPALGLGLSIDALALDGLLAETLSWQAAHEALQGFDALLCPTVPIVAPPVADLLASDEAFFKANGLLLRNTFVGNFLDCCSFSLPCHAEGELPVGLMLTAPGGQDAALAGVALAVEAVLGQR